VCLSHIDCPAEPLIYIYNNDDDNNQGVDRAYNETIEQYADILDAASAQPTSPNLNPPVAGAAVQPGARAASPASKRQGQGGQGGPASPRRSATPAASTSPGGIGARV
jgi:hypothetical protein